MFSEKLINFNSTIKFNGKLPKGISIMNPFLENQHVIPVITEFYKKFYNDNRKRYMIIGINPGRFGAGITGLPFTDTKRLKLYCDIEIPDMQSHELSSVFIYDMINKYGGVSNFYSNFYFWAMCPLGFTRRNDKGREVNYNYYDSMELWQIMKRFIKKNLVTQINYGIKTDIIFCLGNKNAKFLKEINDESGLFGKIVTLEHPRYIMQYRLKSKDIFIDKYLRAFSEISKSRH